MCGKNWAVWDYAFEGIRARRKAMSWCDRMWHRGLDEESGGCGWGRPQWMDVARRYGWTSDLEAQRCPLEVERPSPVLYLLCFAHVPLRHRVSMGHPVEASLECVVESQARNHPRDLSHIHRNVPFRAQDSMELFGVVFPGGQAG